LYYFSYLYNLRINNMAEHKHIWPETIRLCGTWNVGSKWQIVIPKDARKAMGIEPGDSVTFLLKDEKFFWVVSNANIGCLLEYIDSQKDLTLIK